MSDLLMHLFLHQFAHAQSVRSLMLTSIFTSFPATSGGSKSAILPEITQYVYIYTLSIYGMGCTPRAENTDGIAAEFSPKLLAENPDGSRTDCPKHFQVQYSVRFVAEYVRNLGRLSH